MLRFKNKVLWLALCILALIQGGCDVVDDTRIPWAEVRIVFNTPAEWDAYGVPGAMSWQRFIKSEHLPHNYPYTQLTFTGFGGVLLVSDVLGNPQAYDLACPVEALYTCRIDIDRETHLACCPQCGSTYDVFINYGAPISGPAAQKHLGLKRYYAGPGRHGEYREVGPLY